ncbi:MAG: hypothetical protein ACFCUX_00210 [Candidatus Methylacidiphilales bacterium]
MKSRFRKSTWLAARPDAVLDFHLDPNNLKVVQPPGSRLLQGSFPDRLTVGSCCQFVVGMPWGVDHWEIVVDEIKLPSKQEEGWMVDRAEKSPFKFWIHRHRVTPEASGCRLTDEIEFAPPGPSALDVLSIAPTWIALWFLFWFRHLKTRLHFLALSPNLERSGDVKR